MSEPENDLDLNRTDVMWILHAEGRTFPEMIRPLVQLGLLVCHPAHQKRVNQDGEEVCATCENTLCVTWSRYLKRIGATKEDADEVRGKWLHAYEEVAEICMKRYVQDVVVTTTRIETVTRTEVVNGATVTTQTDTPITTTRKETKIHVALLRLYLDVRDKVARVGGLNIEKVIPRIPTRRRLLAPREVDPNGDDAPAN